MHPSIEKERILCITYRCSVKSGKLHSYIQLLLLVNSGLVQTKLVVASDEEVLLSANFQLSLCFRQAEAYCALFPKESGPIYSSRLRSEMNDTN